MLLPHIFNFNRQQRSKFQGFFQCAVRLIGVHMHLDNIIIFHHDKRIANITQNGAHPVHIARFITPFRNKFGAISKGNVLVLNCTEISCRPGRFRFSSPFAVDAAKRVKHTGKDGQEAKPAGIHNPGFRKHGILGGCLCKRFFSPFNYSAENLLNRQLRVSLAEFQCVLGRNA